MQRCELSSRKAETRQGRAQQRYDRSRASATIGRTSLVFIYHLIINVSMTLNGIENNHKVHECH